MFETFDSASSAPAARRFALSTTASVAVFGLIAVAAMTAANTVKEVIKEKKVDVVFRPPPPPPPPVVEVKPPPPPPPPVAKPPPRAAPPVAKAAPPPAAVPTVAPAPLKAPDAVPLDKPPEAEKEVVAAAPMAVGGTGTLVPGGVVGGTGSGEGMAIGGGRAQPINLPETGTPPEPLAANLIPEYPSDARSKGLEGLVILKGVVEVDGRVTGLKVMRGDEPFASAALAAVRTWRFKPAVVSGQPTAVFRIFKVPFRLKS
ncbi:ferric siderophore transporter, periplasmic energy transduction protein TonB [Corallococcus coralloides DSM 2259]|uniref:Ferric siderophore transporter, periplasmic energy transduction protein TonB n=2 Tax=Corallococcus TaxID=83461 RepID=H8MTC1_CORCM|nr:energy transducer TonB [Corallococcus coralloides]AFE10521.1 ferric siderophore transporter, periplasmic energy transduction protein TonB [Corallococcus coralloides DSM 2259]